MDIIGSINTRFLSKSEQSKNEIFNKIDNIVIFITTEFIPKNT
ncbi:MAG: hypothetical protein E7C60_13130 [Clostridium perfringens]|nr:hypothetical protein [Clostridium perfringens]